MVLLGNRIVVVVHEGSHRMDLVELEAGAEATAALLSRSRSADGADGNDMKAVYLLHQPPVSRSNGRRFFFSPCLCCTWCV